jgi:DNA-binding HxlR family transcriptional regulator
LEILGERWTLLVLQEALLGPYISTCMSGHPD